MMAMKWEAKIIKYRGESRIGVHFEKDADMIARIKQFEDSKWSQQLKVWHLPDTEENRIKFKLATASSLLPSEEGIIQIERQMVLDNRRHRRQMQEQSDLHRREMMRSEVNFIQRMTRTRLRPLELQLQQEAYDNRTPTLNLEFKRNNPPRRP
jgi:hypothetical protein